ncbi:hypothetical protein HHI36_009247 [Cryptolaemus montrouzieri]|uniref:Uncharacterized protein n=1 Tax=Cryptolaemus montrouzieri TaxID=559131 RepID=A0ABD2MV93_9CUCU
MRNMKTRLHELMNRRFAYIKGYPALISSTLLDPRFKSTYLNSDEVDIATLEIENHLRICKDDVSDTISENCHSGEPQPSCSSRIASFEKVEGLWDAHNKSTCNLINTSGVENYS